MKKVTIISYRQSQTEDGGSVVKVVNHLIVTCIVHLHMSVRVNVTMCGQNNLTGIAWIIVSRLGEVAAVRFYLSREAESSLCPLLPRCKHVTVL